MSHVNAGDPRAHTDHREKERHARALVAKVRELILEDQPPGVDPCNECAVVTLMLALGFLGADIANGDLFDEKMGAARRFGVFKGLSETVARALTASAFQSPDAAGLAEIFELDAA